MKALIFVSLFLNVSFCYAERFVRVDLKNFKFYAYEDDKLIREGLATGGKKYCPDIKRGCRTPIGEFFVINKRGRWYRSPIYPLNCGNPKEGKERCASMAWAVRFKYSGESFHASNDDWKNLKHWSHGCIHLQELDAIWINKWIQLGDKVIILPY